MFFLTYMLSELRRRSGRTVLTALGLGLGVGLVVTVSALSTGLDRAQAAILEPLTGVGTDMSVSRPIDLSPSEGGAFPQLSEDERKQLEQENGGGRFGLRNLGEPGEKFSRDDFVSTAQLSFAASTASAIADIDGVSAAAGGLTLNSIHIEGTVPKESETPTQSQTFEQDQGGPSLSVGPRNIDATALSVTGVDETQRSIGAITPGQVTTGRYFRSGAAREAVVNESYAAREEIAPGDELTLGGKTFTVVGTAETPLGGQSSDVYVKLDQLQALSGRKGRVNTVYVRAKSGDDVESVASAIERTLEGASVTTAADLADRVSGTLVDARNLAGSLGRALMIVGLLAAFLIASLLTLSSVTKRIRELGTLKAIGWSQRLVVRQVTGESLIQGLLGGVIGVVLGIVGALAIGAFGPTLEATVGAASEQGPRFFGPFGQGAVETSATEVALDAPISPTIVLWAVGLALLGGLVAGAVGSLRASRLRPADALRHID
ncbi:MAG TPA: ABC transporter permease [Gaiellaceae bacterium]|nr:ABC transporter permease [Gaiellaceae bacterium]